MTIRVGLTQVIHYYFFLIIQTFTATASVAWASPFPLFPKRMIFPSLL